DSEHETAGIVFEASGLKKEFDDGQVQALRGVDFRIAHGEFVAVIGQSGCGKTTLLQMLGALDKPSAGTLRYRGDSIADLPDPAGQGSASPSPAAWPTDLPCSSRTNRRATSTAKTRATFWNSSFASSTSRI